MNDDGFDFPMQSKLISPFSLNTSISNQECEFSNNNVLHENTIFSVYITISFS